MKILQVFDTGMKLSVLYAVGDLERRASDGVRFGFVPVVAMTASFRRMWVQLQGDLKDAALELGIWSMPQHVSGKQHVFLGL